MIDLHTHSTYSDGTLTPTELVRLAVDSGVTAMALCDHNTVDGLPEFLKAARESGMEAIPGVEFSTEHGGGELHILGLFIAPEAYESVRELLAAMLARKEQSNRALVRGLNEAGLRLDYGRIKASTDGGFVNRAVIAAEMVRQGYCASVSEAFKGWLAPERGFFVPPKRLDSLEVIRFIRSIGAVSVLAHPFLDLDETGLRRFLAEAVPAGLDAMEVWYSKFSPEQIGLAEHIAREFELLMSGGSDFHGANKPDIALGRGRGELRVPVDCLERLRTRREKQKNNETLWK